MNAAATEDLIELVELGGEEWLLYKAPKKIDVAIIRGTLADENGNISMRKEGYKLGQLAAAVDAAVEPLGSEAQGRAMYLNQYLFHRKSYQSADEQNFKTIMEQNKTVLDITEEDPELLHSNAWFTGEGEWMEHSGEIDAWAERPDRRAESAGICGNP